MSYLRIIPATLIAGVLFFHFPNILGVVPPTPATPQVPAGPTPPPSLGDLYVSENLDGGAKLQMSNGEIYEISPSDRAISSAWLLPSNITLTPSKSLDYPIIITNTVSNTSVQARKFDPAQPPVNPNSKNLKTTPPKPMTP